MRAGIHNTETMEHTKFVNDRKEMNYCAPSIRIISSYIEQSFLASNLEPIDGGDDSDIDW